MSRPLALAKLPGALRDKAAKVSDPHVANYLSQAADALDKQAQKIQMLHSRNTVAKRRIAELEEPSPVVKKLIREEYYPQDDSDWWDADPDDDLFHY